MKIRIYTVDGNYQDIWVQQKSFHEFVLDFTHKREQLLEAKDDNGTNIAIPCDKVTSFSEINVPSDFFDNAEHTVDLTKMRLNDD